MVKIVCQDSSVQLYVSPCTLVQVRLNGIVKFEVELSLFTILAVISTAVCSAMWGSCRVMIKTVCNK
jgi:hypothetical protein